MKITISKSQWEEIGRQGKWLKKADFEGFGTGEDKINILVQEAIHNPKAFKDCLRENPELAESFSNLMQHQESGYKRISDENEIWKKRERQEEEGHYQR